MLSTMGDTDVAVVGAGVIGLSTAIAVQERLPQVHVTLFSQTFSPGTTSDVAAGLWQPYCLGETPVDRIR